MESNRPARGLLSYSRDEGRWMETKVMAEQKIVAAGGSWHYKGEESYQVVWGLTLKRKKKGEKREIT